MGKKRKGTKSQIWTTYCAEDVIQTKDHMSKRLQQFLIWTKYTEEVIQTKHQTYKLLHQKYPKRNR